MTVPTLSLEPGFWRSSETSKEVLPCLDKRHCKGGSNVTDLCTEGYTGPLCAVCQPNYASTGSGQTLTCSKCGGSAFATIAAISTTFFVIITASICYCLRRGGETPIEKKSLTAHDDLNRLRTFSKDAKKKAMAMATFVDEAGPILKILFSYFQIATTLPFVLNLRFPPIFSSSLKVVSGIVNVNVISLMPVGCLLSSNFHTTLLAYTLLPTIIGLAMVASYHLMKKSDNQDVILLSNKVFASFLLLTFLILPTVSTQIFSTFACTTFDESYGSYLKVDLSINCSSSSHKMFVYYAIGMAFLYPIGVPLYYMKLLNQNRQYLDPGQRNFTFELRNEEEGMKKAIEKRKELEELHPHVKRLSFLYSSYEPQCYWFEVVETVRKLVLTAGLIFFQPGTAAQIVLSILVCLLSMRVYSGWKPFVSEEHDKLAEVAQWQLFFVMFAALLIRVNMDGESLQDKVYFDLMLVIIQFGAPALLVAQRLIPKKKGRIGRFFSAAADLTGFGAFGVFEAAEGLKNEFGDDVVEMVNNPLDKNRQLRAVSSGRFGLGEEVVAKKLKKKKKKKKKDDGESGGVDTAKDKKLFQRLESGGYNKKAVIGVGKKGLLEVKKAAAVPTPQTKEDEVEKTRIYVYKDAEGSKDNDMEEEEDEVPPAPPPPPTWEEHKDEESGQFYYHNAKTNETRWEKPN